MRFFHQLCTLVCFAIAMMSNPAAGTEYFVRPDGNDEQDGRGAATALRTIQRGVDALASGDTLTIAPGEYHETVFRDGLGSAERETLIRAAIPGTVLLRGDVPAPTFDKVAGLRFVYAAPFEQAAQVVNEVDTLWVMEQAPSVAHLEFTPGACYYDSDRRMLYIAPSDLQPPEAHRYTVSVTPAFGLYIQNPVRVVLDGLAATGFNSTTAGPWYPGGRGVYGLMLGHAQHCAVRRCTAYLNGGGIAIDTRKEGAGHNVIEYCTTYGNNSQYTDEGGNIVTFGADHNIIRHCYSYSAGQHGLRHYGSSIRGPAIIRDCIAWGSRHSDLFIKGGKAPDVGIVENVVTLGPTHFGNIAQSLVGMVNKYHGAYTGNNIVYTDHTRTIEDHEFADPANLDFRLQATSKFRSRYGNALDSGPYPYEPDIHYVKSDGDDEADGLSLRHAWRTLDHAVTRLRPGHTLYLEPGTYPLGTLVNVKAVSDDQVQPIRIRGRGASPAVITGKVQVTGGGIEFERIHFAGPVVLDGGRDVGFEQCLFMDESIGMRAARVAGLRVLHCAFAGEKATAIEADRCDDLFLSSNIYSRDDGPAVVLTRSNVRYSDYNSYRHAGTAWRVDASVQSLDELKPGNDVYSIVRVPVFARADDAVQLLNPIAFAGAGRHGRAIGMHHAFRRRDLRFVGPELHAQTDTTANLVWWTAVPAKCRIGWGLTPDCVNQRVIQTRRFASFSLTGLEPEKTYYFRLLSVEPAKSWDALVTRGVEPTDAPLTFRTNSRPPIPITYHVAPDGNDRATGRTRGDAWRTIAHAGTQVTAGDTVLIAGGVYRDAVHIRASGQPGFPITFKAAPGERVVFDGIDGRITVAFYADRKQYIRLDGLYFVRFGKSTTGWDGLLSFTDCHDVRITRCFMNGHDNIGLSPHFVSAFGSSDLLIKNCVIANGMYGAYFEGVENLRIENNVFLRPLITEWNNGAGAIAKGNIFVDSQPYKADGGVHLFELGGFERHVFENNVFYLRHPDAQRKPFLFYGTGPGRLSVAEYQQRTGRDTNLLLDPRFKITMDTTPVDHNGEKLTFVGDWVLSRPNLDFPDLFVTHPTLNGRDIGLIPGDFADFHFNVAVPRESP